MVEAKMARRDAERKAAADVAKEEHKTSFEKAAITEKVKHQTQVLEDATDKQVKEYEAEVNKHAQRMKVVQDAASESDASSAQLVHKVNKYFETAQKHARLRIKKAVDDTREAQEKTAAEQQKANAEDKEAKRIAKAAAKAEEEKVKAEVLKVK